MISVMRNINNLIEPLRKVANCVGSPLFDLAIRLYIAHTFLKSGMGRFRDWWNGSWDSQVYLFTDIHPVPGFDPSLAAAAATLGELILPVLLGLGLFARVGAAGIFIMTTVIFLTFSDAIWFETLVWWTMTACVFIKGPGMISVDYWLVKWLRKE